MKYTTHNLIPLIGKEFSVQVVLDRVWSDLISVVISSGGDRDKNARALRFLTVLNGVPEGTSEAMWVLYLKDATDWLKTL